MAGELKNSNEYQRKFIANVSHDFRSPLTSIKGYAEAIRDGVVPYEMQDKYLGIIVSESERLTKLSREMLTLEKVDPMTAMLNPSVFNLNAMIKETSEAFGSACLSKNIVINLLLEGEEIYVRADYSRIQQVLYNLIDNAIKFSKKDSSIEIETSTLKNKARISVKDHGAGIASSDLPKIWERFYKTDPSRGRDPKGTGLGLSIVKDIIQAHNQKISVISTPGIGSEFTFTLDLAQEV